MTREPNKGNFFAQLKNESFSPSALLENTDDLQEILWYLDASRADEVVKDFFNPEMLSCKEAGQVIKNLAKVYPLSQPLVMKIMEQVREPRYSDGGRLYRDALFLEGFDAAEEVKRTILNTFTQIKERLGRLSRESQNYENELKNLQGKRDTLEREAGKLEDLRRQRDKIQSQVKQLQTDTDENKLREQIDALQVELNQLEGTRRRRLNEISEKRKRIDEVKLELRDLEKQMDSSEETRLIRELLKKFPTDAEDES